MIKAVVILACIILLTHGGELARSQTSASAALVDITDLKPEYPSCGQVRFSIKNMSHRDLYVEVYAERLEAGTWNYEDYPYDIKDPKSRYIKRVLVNPEPLKPGASLHITYDRCQRPTFVKQSDEQYQKGIIEKDLKSAPSSLQRFRVPIYFLDQGHIKFVKNVFSEPFKRIVPGG